MLFRSIRSVFTIEVTESKLAFFLDLMRFNFYLITVFLIFN